MVRNLLIIVLFHAIPLLLPGQDIKSFQVEAWINQRLASQSAGVDPGRNGAGLSFAYLHPISTRHTAQIYAEAGAAGAGNYFSSGLGTHRSWSMGGRGGRYEPGLKLNLGFLLTRPNVLFLWGIEQSNTFYFTPGGKNLPGLLFAFRYYAIPAYSDYSSNTAFLDLKIGVRFRF